MLFKKTLTLLLTLLMCITILGVNTNITKAEGEEETSNEPLTQEVSEVTNNNDEEEIINTISIKEDLIDIEEELNKEITLSFEIEDTEYQEYTYIWSFYDESDTLINEVKHEHIPNHKDTLTITLDEESLNYKYLQVKVIGETNNSELLSSKVSINISGQIQEEITPEEVKETLVTPKLTTLGATNNTITSTIYWRLIPNVIDHINDGTYTLKISSSYLGTSSDICGTTDGKFSSNGQPWRNYCSSVTKITIVNSITPSKTAYWFSDLENVTTIEGLNYLNVENVTDMNHMFSNCSSLKSLDISTFDTRNVTNMYGLFYNCASLTSLDLTELLTWSVTNMSEMFWGCSSLSKLFISNFYTNNVTDMHGMFGKCSTLPTLDLSSFVTNNVTDMGVMFYECSSLTSLNILNFNTDNVKKVNGMFSNCSSLTSLDISSFNTSKVTNMRTMFSKCSLLENLDLSTFDTTNVEDVSNMFDSCSKMSKIIVSKDFKLDNVTESDNMFYLCNQIKGGLGTTYNESKIDKTYARIDGGTNSPGYFTSEIEVSFDTKGGEEIASTKCLLQGEVYGDLPTPTKEDCNFLGWYLEDSYLNKVTSTTVVEVSDDVTLFAKWSEPDTTHNIYWYLTNSNKTLHLTKNIKPTTSTSGKVKASYQPVNSSITNPEWYQYKDSITKVFIDDEIKPLSTAFWFFGLEKVTNIYDISNIDMSEVTNINAMFSGCSSLEELDLSSFNTTNVKQMSSTFGNCESLASLSLASFNTPNLEQMGLMFSGCTNLKSIDFGAFDTSKVKNMTGMFSDCSSLKLLDLSSFISTNIIYVDYMFQRCSSLEKILVNKNFDLKNAEGSYMFSECTSLVGGKGTKYNSNYVNRAYAHVDGGEINPGYFSVVDSSAPITKEQLYVGLVNEYDYLDYQKSFGYGYYGSSFTSAASFYIYEENNDSYRKVNNVISSNDTIVSYNNGNNTLTINNKGYTTLSYKENGITYVIDYNPLEVYMYNGKLKATFNNTEYLTYQNNIQLWIEEENGKCGRDTYISKNNSYSANWEKTKKNNEYLFSDINTYGLESGSYRVRYAVDSWNTVFCIKNIKITSSVKTKPIFDKNPIQQTVNGSLKIYSKDKDFLTNVCSSSGNARVYFDYDGTAISISNYNNNNNISGPYEETIEGVTYYYISISKTVLENCGVSANTYDMRLFANGYAMSRFGYPDFEDISITTSLQRYPSDISISFDGSIGLIINSDTKEYLQSINSITIYSPITGNSYSFNKQNSELNYDVENEYLYISNNTLNNRSVLSGQQFNQVGIYANGYSDNRTYCSDLTIYTSVVEAPSDVDISFDKNIGLIIKSTNKNYLKNISRLGIFESQVSYGTFFTKDTNGIEYDPTNMYAYISIKTLKNNYFVEGTYKYFRIEAPGYSPRYISNKDIKIITGIKACPSDVTVTFDNKIGIIIKSSNTTYLQKVRGMEIWSNNDSDCYGHFLSSTSDLKYDSKKKYLFVSIDSLIECGTLSGTYNQIILYSDEYGLIEYNNSNLVVNTPVIKAPDLSVSYDGTKGVIINSNTKEYLQNIKSITISSETLHEGRIFYKEYNEIVYDTDNQYAYIPNSVLENAGVVSGVYSYITIESTNYADKKINSLNLVISTSIVAPPSVEVALATGEGLMIYSEDKTYLQNITFVDLYSNSLQSGNYFTSTDSDFEYKEDATFSEGKTGYLCISDAKLVEHLITNGIYDSIVIESMGYGRKTAVGVVITESTVPAAPSDISITFNNKVGLIINSSNKDYLKTMNFIGVSAANCGDAFYKKDSELIYDNSGNYLYVPLAIIKNHKLIERTYTYFNLFSTKYSNKGINANINITSGIKIHPNDINISFDENVGIIFKSSNTDYLQKIEFISLYTNIENEYDYFTSKDFTYDKKNSRLVISTNRLNNGSITTSTIKEAYISAVNYNNNSIQNIDLPIETTVKNSYFVNVTYEYDKNVGIILKSDNKEYLKNALYINFRIGNRTLEKVAKYDEVNEYLYVKLTDVYECVDDFGTYDISLISIKENGYSNKILENVGSVNLDSNSYFNYLNTHNDYEIIYRLNGGINDQLNPSGYNFGDPNITLKSPTKEGYTFAGWYDSNNKKVTSINKGTTGDIVLTAKYTENTYKLAYNANGGKGSLPKTLTYKYTDYNAVTELEPIRVGYTFLGWSLDKKATVPTYTKGNNIKGINRDSKSGSTITLYAVWEPITYMIKFVGNNTNLHNPDETYGSVDGYISVKYDETITLTNLYSPKNSAVKFSNWSAVVNNKIVTYKDKTKVKNLATEEDKVIEFTANWSYLKNLVNKITYNLNGGKNDLSNPSSYNIDTPSFTLKDPTRTGYSFVGWYLDKALTNELDDLPCGDENNYGKTINLYAKWTIITYTVELNDVGSNEKEIYEYNVNSPTKDLTMKANGYVFSGWYTEYDSELEELSGQVITKITKGSTGNLTLYGCWFYEIYTITYKLNGGVLDEDNPTEFRICDTVYFNDPKKSGYCFDGWYLNSKFKGERYYGFAEGSYGNQTLYAKWISIASLQKEKQSLQTKKEKAYNDYLKVYMKYYQAAAIEEEGLKPLEEEYTKAYKKYHNSTSRSDQLALSSAKNNYESYKNNKMPATKKIEEARLKYNNIASECDERIAEIDNMISNAQ